MALCLIHRFREQLNSSRDPPFPRATLFFANRVVSVCLKQNDHNCSTVGGPPNEIGEGCVWTLERSPKTQVCFVVLPLLQLQPNDHPSELAHSSSICVEVLRCHRSLKLGQKCQYCCQKITLAVILFKYCAFANQSVKVTFSWVYDQV